MSNAATPVTQILDAVARGDESATDELLALVYAEMRNLAAAQMGRERNDHTLQATALVHETYLRLLGDGVSWESRGHFFGAAAEAMRRILIDHARSRGRQRRGGDRDRVALNGADLAGPTEKHDEHLDLLVLDEALCRMEVEDPRMAQVVKLRFFTGLSIEDTALAIGVSAMTVTRTWRCARAWLHGEVHDGDA